MTLRMPVGYKVNAKNALMAYDVNAKIALMAYDANATDTAGGLWLVN